MGKAFDDIRQGLEEAVAYAKGDTSKGRVHVPAPNAREVRERLGLTQRELADLCDLSLGTVTKWEQGHRVPRGPSAALLRILDNEPKAAIRALRTPAAAKTSPTGRAARDTPERSKSRRKSASKKKQAAG